MKTTEIIKKGTVKRMDFIDVGFGNYVARSRIVAVASPDSCLLYTSDAADD